MFFYFSSNLVFISLINNKRIQCLLYWDVFLAILEAFILKIFRESKPPDPPRTLAPAARAKNALSFYLTAQSQKCCPVPDMGSNLDKKIPEVDVNFKSECTEKSSKIAKLRPQFKT